MRRYSRAYWFLLWELTRTEFRLRDQGTLLGFLWTLLHPALMFTVLYMLFIKWMGKFVDQYDAYLIIGLIQWQFFEKATTMSLTSLRRKSTLIRNFKCPQDIIVFSSVGCVFWSYLLELAVMLVILLVLGITPAAKWLLLPFFVLTHLALTLGVSMILAVIAVEFQDLERIWSILMTAGFFVTPVFYPLSILSERYQRLMDFNPLVHILSGFRMCLLPDYTGSAGAVAAVGFAGGLLILATVQILTHCSYWITDRVLQP